MVSTKTLRAYNWTDIDSYFNYIIESKGNGQNSQVESLIKAMSKSQKKECLIFFNNESPSEDLTYCKNKLIELM